MRQAENDFFQDAGGGDDANIYLAWNRFDVRITKIFPSRARVPHTLKQDGVSFLYLLLLLSSLVLENRPNFLSFPRYATFSLVL